MHNNNYYNGSSLDARKSKLSNAADGDRKTLVGEGDPLSANKRACLPF